MSVKKLCWAFFRKCRHAKRNIWPHLFARFSLSKKNAGLDQNLSWIIKTSKRWHLNVANCYGGNKIQNITQTLELFEAAEKNYWDDVAVESFSFQIHQGTQRVPRITVTVANIPHMHITIRNLGISSGLYFFFKSTRGSWKKTIFHGFSSLWLWNFHFYPRCAPWGSEGQANKTSGRFYPGQTSAVFPRYLISLRFPHCSVQMVLIMSSRTSS